MKKASILSLIVLLALVLASSALAEPTKHRAIVKFEKSIKSTGEVNFTFTAEGGDPINLKVNATKGVTKATVADQLRREFDKVLDPSHFEVKMNTDTQVLIMKRRSGPLFDLTLGEQTISGLAVSIKLK